MVNKYIVTPVLSIIIPVYKVEKYIHRCLDSIYNQVIDLRLFEVIVVNDGSPDNSVSIINEFVTSYSNIKLISQPNSGLSVARNTGLLHAEGDYVWFVDSDDWLKENSLQIILNYIDNYKCVLFASTLEYSYDDSQRNKLERNLKEDLFLSSSEYLLSYSVGASQRYIIKRSLLVDNNIKFYPNILHEDNEFGPRVLVAAKNVLLIHKIVYNYYQRSGSIMSSWNIYNTKGALCAYESVIKLSRTISEKSLYNAVLYFALKCLVFSFPKQYIDSSLDIRQLYNQYRKEIRVLSWQLLFSTLPLKKRGKAFVIMLQNLF